MKSPFPGMDPYIEECGLFEDFHQKLIGEMERALSQSLPDPYLVRTNERSYIVLAGRDGKVEHIFLPDVGIISPTSLRTTVPPSAALAVAEPALETDAISMQAFIATEYRENFIEIYALKPERHLVTCIEVLSPSNKRAGTPSWDLYLRKRQAMLLGENNLIEIDLLRGGEKMPILDPYPKSPYSLLVSWRFRATNCRVWPVHLQRPLPTIPVPLVLPDPDAALDLQPMIEAIYARSRYSREIDYKRPLSRPLTAEESTWLAEQLRQRADL